MTSNFTLTSARQQSRAWILNWRWVQWLDPSLRRRIMSGAIWSIAGAGLASALTMAGNVFCARVLGPSSFGELAIVLATTNLFTTLFTSGLGMTATRFVAENRHSNPQRAGTIVGFSWVTSIVVGAAATLLMLAASPWLSRDVLGASGLNRALSLGALAMFFAALNGSQVGALSGVEAFHWIAFGNLVRGVGTILIVTAGAVLAGLPGALTGYVVVGAATAAFYQLAVRRECASENIPISYRFGRDDLRLLWRFTLPVLVTTFSFTPAAWWSNVLLAKTSGYSEAGVFNAVFHWQLFILFFSNAISGIGLPMLSNLRAERNPSKYKRCLAMNFVLTSVPAIAVAIPVAICAPLIMRLYGPAFAHGAPALMWIGVASVLSAANLAVGHALWSLDATRLAVLLALVRGGSLVLASYALAGYGASGLAGAHVIMGLVQTAVTIPVMAWLLRREFAPAPARELVALT